MANIRLEHLVDSGVFQGILDNFSKVTGIAVVAVNYRGEPITQYTNFTDFCFEFRKNGNCRAKCFQSDAHGGVEAARSGKPYIYKCHSGLTDFAVPIIDNGQYLGAILAGQVKVLDYEYPDINTTIDPYVESVLNQSELMVLHRKVPTITREQLENASELLFLMANYIVEKAMRSHVQEELNEKNERLIQSMKQRMELEKNLQESELRLLQSQVNPHFLFNVLNTIHSLAMIESAPKTSDMVCNLSEMLRYTIQNKMHHLVTLEEEVEYTQKYMSIQQARVGDMIQFNIDIPEKLYGTKLPFMVIQPFVSNAINHGLFGYREEGEIRVWAEKNGKDCLLHISDNGVGMSESTLDRIRKGERCSEGSKSTGIGIYNTNRRLVHLFGEQYTLDVNSKAGVGTKITIRLPR